MATENLLFAIRPEKGDTPASIRRKRELADAIMGRRSGGARNVGEGVGNALTSIGDGIAARIMNKRADASESAGQASASGAMDSIFGGLSGFPAAPSAGGSGLVASSDPSVSPNVNVGSTIDFARAGQSDGGGSPYRDAIASIESAGSGDYAAVGPTHPKLGRALGRYQVMEANIGPWSREALGREVTPDAFLADPKLQDAIFDAKFGGYVKQFGSPEAAAQAWFGGPGGVGKTDRKDVLGTSIGQYGEKFNKALGGQPMAEPAPVQVASLDPSAGMSSVPPEFASMGLTPEAWQRMNAPDAQAAPQPAPALPAPRMVPDMPIAATQPPQQTAQAASPQDLSALPVTAGGTAGALQPGQSSGPSLQQLLQAAQNPWLNENQRGVVNMLLEQEMQKQDPMRQLQMQKLQKEISGSDAGEFKVVGDQLVRIAPGGVISDVTPAGAQGEVPGAFRFGGKSVEAQALNGLMDSGQLTPEQAQQLGAGKTITGPNGEIIFMTPQGVFGQPAGGGAPQPLGSQPAPQQQGNIPITTPKVTVDEKKAMTFADRMATSGAIIDSMGMKGSGKMDRTVSGVPFVGEYLTSDDFKKVDAAKRDFINAQLRRESGAVIADSEFANAEQQYFPQPNDPPEVVEQKKQLRKRVIDGMQRDAGPTYQDPTAQEWTEISPGVRIRKVK